MRSEKVLLAAVLVAVMMFLFFQIFGGSGGNSAYACSRRVERMKIPGCAALLALLVVLPPGAFSQPSAKQPDYAATGRHTVSALAQGQWAKVEARFDQRMKAALPAEKLEGVWKQITDTNGAFERVLDVKVEEKSGYHIAVVSCAFARGNVDAKVVVDGAGRIAGLFFAPAAPPASSPGPPPDYAAIARETVTALVQEKFASIEARFDQRMKTALPESKLSATWRQITAQAGDFKHISRVKLSEQDGYHVAMVACVFAHASLDAKVVMDADGRIAGLFFVPAT
jgi:hypothetical protein